MARQIPSRVAVTGLVASALVAVSVLAIQANGATTDASRDGGQPSTSASPSKSKTPKSPALPANSGEGKRIVYSLKLNRVWIVNAREKSVATFAVWPGSVDPIVGLHRVSRLLPDTVGTDGVPIEHVIYFSAVGNTAVAFSAALDGSSPKPVEGKETGGVRMRRSDGEKLWDFATIGTPVIVVP
ncbi:hypothetical protein GCM10027168_15050 [Streptomyces capparidis]